jgi:hypothetical protein
MRSKPTLTSFAVSAVAACALLLIAGCDHHYYRRDRWRESELRARCGKIMDRIDYDHQKIDEIEPGRHEKAKQWYVDDIENAERDLDRCRASID